MALMQRRLDQILKAEPAEALTLLWQEHRLADEARRQRSSLLRSTAWCCAASCLA